MLVPYLPVILVSNLSTYIHDGVVYCTSRSMYISTARLMLFCFKDHDHAYDPVTYSRRHPTRLGFILKHSDWGSCIIIFVPANHCLSNLNITSNATCTKYT